MDILTELEQGWGGTPKQRLDARYRKYAAEYGVGAPAVSPEQESEAADQANPPTEAPQPIVRDAQSPAPEPAAANPAAPAAGAPAPASPPSPTPTATPAQTPGNPQ